VRETSGGSTDALQLWDGGDVGEEEKDDAQPTRLPVDGEEGKATWWWGKTVELRRNLDWKSA
jgi:hypothetical protein